MPTPPTNKQGDATAITIENLSKIFPASSGGKPSAAVDGISLNIEPGELFFLLGPSGCGKTTLLRMIAGFIEPSGGRILFTRAGETRDVTHAPANARETGMVFQSYALWPHMSVFENVGFGLDIRKVKGEERRRRIMEALGSVQMADYAQRKPNQLSGGQQQRIALARAMVIRPSVLLLDEPLSNLDAKLRIELRSEIRRLCKAAGMTTVYVTHDQKEALSMADRIAILRSGRIVQVGTPAGLYRQPGDAFVCEFLGETNFFSGTVRAVADETTHIETPAGVLRAASATSSVGSTVRLSIRPEALSAAPGENTLSGRLVETTYLGESVQLVVEVAPGLRVRSAVSNPGPDLPAAGSAIRLSVSPADIVVLPA